MRRHEMRVGRMPEVYAPSAMERRVCGIMGDQVAALRELVGRDGCKVGELPRHGGYELLPKAAKPPPGPAGA